MNRLRFNGTLYFLATAVHRLPLKVNFYCGVILAQRVDFIRKPSYCGHIAVPKELNETELKEEFKRDPYAREFIPKTLFEDRSALIGSKFKDKISISFFDGYRHTSSCLSIVKEWEKDWLIMDNYTSDITSVDELLSVRSLKGDAKKLMKEFKEAI